MTKQNQILALEKTIKSQHERARTTIFHDVQQPARFDGRLRTYQPIDEENGEKFPDESQMVELHVDDLLEKFSEITTRLMDLIATKDDTNTKARANVVVDGQTILSDVPVTTLLFLETDLGWLYNFARKLPTLNPTKRWSETPDPTAGAYRAEPVQTIKTKKVLSHKVVWEPPSPEFRQDPKVETWQEDVKVGDWTTAALSGAWPAEKVEQLLERIQKLQQAVKFAREEANNTDVTDKKIGKRVFDFLLAE